MQLKKLPFLAHTFSGALEDWSKSSYDLLDFRICHKTQGGERGKGKGSWVYAVPLATACYSSKFNL